ncbi:MAG: class I SAM-dependent methyltransferase [Nitriliruptor sp.]|nr:MAG: class I SAM-dependent methyltransferase [Nitriliruptor sp.]
MDAASWDERYRERELVWSAGPNAVVAEQLADHPRGRALDLAAGEGRNALWLAEQGFEVEAVEFSPVAIDKGRALAAHRRVPVTFTLADLTGPMDLAPADVVLLAYLHLPRAVERDVLRRVAALVAPGGTFLLIAHARRNLDEGVGGPQDPELLPTAQEVTAAIEGTGLVLERAGEVTRETEVEGEQRTAIDLLVRAHRPA